MELGKATIRLDRQWDLEDLNVFSKDYVHIYNLCYVLRLLDENENLNLDVEIMPWQGGWSVVGLFRKLRSWVTSDHKPQINRIQYASPGFMELSLMVEVANDVAALVGSISLTITSAASAYHFIYSQYLKRRLSQSKIKELEQRQLRDEIEFVVESVRLLQKEFSLNEKQIETMKKLTKGDELVQLKLLLALFRKAKPLAQLQIDKKADFDTTPKMHNNGLHEDS